MDYKQNNFTGFIQKQISFRDWLIGDYAYSTIRTLQYIRNNVMLNPRSSRTQSAKGKIQPRTVL